MYLKNEMIHEMEQIALKSKDLQMSFMTSKKSLNIILQHESSILVFFSNFISW